MFTVGSDILPLSPVAAWVAVISHSIVLFMFASRGLEAFLKGAGLPTTPLVLVSSFQAVVGAVIGIGPLKWGKEIQWQITGRISAGWIATPLASELVCYIILFFTQNVFLTDVYH